MKKACLIYISIFLGLALALTAVLAALYPSSPDTTPPRPPLLARIPPSGAAALSAALFLALAAAAVDSLAVALRERALVGRSLAGARPEDGRKIAASGVLVAEAAAVQAPFSGTPCVAYHYQIRHTSRGGSSTTMTDCWGYALAPSHVETAAGVVRILGYTDFDFAPTVLTDQAARDRARAYFATTQFVTIGVGALSSAWKALKGVLADDDGSIKTDFGPPSSDLDGPAFSFQERLVLDREEICAFGTYSAPRGGLVPVPGSRDINPVRVMKGSGGAVRRRLLRRAVGQTVLAIVLAAAGAAIVMAFLRFAPTFF